MTSTPTAEDVMMVFAVVVIGLTVAAAVAVVAHPSVTVHVTTEDGVTASVIDCTDDPHTVTPGGHGDGNGWGNPAGGPILIPDTGPVPSDCAVLVHIDITVGWAG